MLLRDGKREVYVLRPTPKEASTQPASAPED